MIIILDGLKSEIQNYSTIWNGRGDLIVSFRPDGVSRNEIRNFLEEMFKIPNVRDVYVPVQAKTNIVSGYAFVKLGSDADVESVLGQLSNLQMGGRTLYINEAKCKACKVAEGSIRSDPLTGEEKIVKLERCARCRMAWYCGKECQNQNWPHHRRDCKKSIDQL